MERGFEAKIHTLSLSGPSGDFVVETLTNFAKKQVDNGTFNVHDLRFLHARNKDFLNPELISRYICHRNIMFFTDDSKHSA